MKIKNILYKHIFLIYTKARSPPNEIIIKNNNIKEEFTMYNQIIKDLEMYLKVSNLSDATKDRYNYCIIKFLKFVEGTEKNINLKTVTEYLYKVKTERKLSNGTINDYRTTIKYLFEVVLDEGWNDRKIPRLKNYNPIPVVLSIK